MSEHKLNRQVLRDNIETISLHIITVEGKATAPKIMKTLREAFGVSLSPGTIYNTLSKLYEKGLIQKRKGIIKVYAPGKQSKEELYSRIKTLEEILNFMRR